VTDEFERRRLRVYVAGPISSGLFEGIHRGIEMGRQMFLDGLAPFIPHFDAFFFLPDGHWNSYLEYDLEFVSVCDAVYRLKGESKGADLECRVATELGIPVFYESDDGNKHPRFSAYRRLLKFAADSNLNGVRV
jgi:hypothetical protein